MAKYEDELSIWVDWSDAGGVLQPAQEAAAEAEIIVPGSVPDGEAGSEQAAIFSKYQKAASWKEAIALEKEEKRAKKKVVPKMAKSSGSEQRPKSAAELKKSLKNKLYRDKKHKLKDFLAHAFAPDSVVLADGGAPAVLADAPLSVMLADAGAPAVLANAPAAVRKYRQGPQSKAQFKRSLINKRYRDRKKLEAALALKSDLPAHKTAKSSVSKRPYIPKGRVCGFCGEKGHIKKTCPQNPDGRPRPDRRRKCFRCSSREHSAAECTARTCADCAKAEPLYPVCSGLENHRASCCNTCNHLVNEPLLFRCEICKGCVYCSKSHVIQSLCRGCCVRKNIDEEDMNK